MKRVTISPTEQSLLESLREAGIVLDAVCNGRGTCGRCKVRVIDPQGIPTRDEQRRLTRSELNQGIRLACQYRPTFETIVEIPEEGSYSILGVESDRFDYRSGDDLLRIAIDIGTTTIAMVMVDPNGTVVGEARFLNPQRTYGADVLSRIQVAIEQDPDILSDVLCSGIEEALRKLTKDYGDRLFRIGVTGNPTMTHFFMRAPVKPIIQVPYSCAVTTQSNFAIDAVFPTLKLKGELIVYPPIAAYVGADILCGLAELGYAHAKGTRLFLDLGTNGELVLLKDGHLFAASTAAGPAFEGGNLSCGIGSVAGAICATDRNIDSSIGYQTLDDQPAIGICGSGYISLLRQIVEHEMDESGLLQHEIKLTDAIRLTQHDVRKFQLAKSAIRSGIEILLEKTDTKVEDIRQFDLAGGFGSHLDLESAIRIGLFPKGLQTKIKIAGNTALRGTVKLLFEPKNTIETDRIHVIELASEATLMNLFIRHLSFTQDGGNEHAQESD